MILEGVRPKSQKDSDNALGQDTLRASADFTSLFIFLFKNNFIYLFVLAVLGLCCCLGFFSLVAASGGYCLVSLRDILVAGHGLWARGLQSLWLTGSVIVVAPGL